MLKKLGKLMLLTTMLLLTACSTGAAGSGSGAIEAGVATDAAGTAAEISLTTRLSLGTVQLEGSEYAVDVEQATILLPLWKLMRTLNESDTTAQAELDAVLEELQASMTSDQLQAIEEMSFSPQDMFATMQESGTDASAQTFGGMAMGGGAVPEGGAAPLGGGAAPGGGAPEMPGGDAMPQGNMAASLGANAGSGTKMDSSAMLLEAVITYLESVVNS